MVFFFFQIQKKKKKNLTLQKSEVRVTELIREGRQCVSWYYPVLVIQCWRQRPGNIHVISQAKVGVLGGQQMQILYWISVFTNENTNLPHVWVPTRGRREKMKIQSALVVRCVLHNPGKHQEAGGHGRAEWGINGRMGRTRHPWRWLKVGEGRDKVDSRNLPAPFPPGLQWKLEDA